MPLLFTMTIAGSIPLICCLILWLILGTGFSVKWGIRLLRASILFYLVPFQLIRHVLPGSWNDFLYRKTGAIEPEIFRYTYSGQFVLPFKGRYLWIPRWLGIILIIWLICTLCFAVFQTVQYLHFMRVLKKGASIRTDSSGKKRVLIHSGNRQSFSIGFLKSYIVMPNDTVSSRQTDYIYRHELSHVQRHDALLKLLCLIVMCLHWFNPLTWILMNTYAVFCEYASDEYVTNHLSVKGCQEYSALLVSMSAANDSLPFVWSNTFLNSKHNLKKRIDRIMANRSVSVPKKTFTLTLSVLFIFLSATTILAYKPPNTYPDNPSSYTEFQFIPRELKSENDPFTSDFDFSLSDTLWQSEDGSIVPLKPSDLQPFASCTHDYRDGIMIFHHGSASGQCTVDQYETTRCMNCGDIRSRTMYTSCQSVHCMHNISHTQTEE